MKNSKKKIKLRRKKLKTEKIRKTGGAEYTNLFNELGLIPIDLKPVTLNEYIDNKNPTDISLEKIVIPILRPSSLDNDSMNIYHKLLGVHPMCTSVLTFSVGYNIMKNILSDKSGYIYIGDKRIVDERELLVISSIDFTNENLLFLESELLQKLSIGGWKKQGKCDINRDYEKFLCNKNIRAEAININNIDIPCGGIHYILKLTGKDIDSNKQYRKDTDNNPILIYCDSTMYSERKLYIDENNDLKYTKTYPGYIVMFICLQEDESKLLELMKAWYSHLVF